MIFIKKYNFTIQIYNSILHKLIMTLVCYSQNTIISNIDNIDNKTMVKGYINQIVKEDMSRSNLSEYSYFGSDDDMSILYLTYK